MKKSDLVSLRKAIDVIDAKLVELLARRFEIVKDIAVLKKEKQINVHDPERIIHVKNSRTELARKHNVPVDLVLSIYEDIIKSSMEYENDVIKGKCNKK